MDSGLFSQHLEEEIHIGEGKGLVFDPSIRLRLRIGPIARPGCVSLWCYRPPSQVTSNIGLDIGLALCKYRADIGLALCKYRADIGLAQGKYRADIGLAPGKYRGGIRLALYKYRVDLGFGRIFNSGCLLQWLIFCANGTYKSPKIHFCNKPTK